jgi:hypothetical protein
MSYEIDINLLAQYDIAALPALAEAMTVLEPAGSAIGALGLFWLAPQMALHFAQPTEDLQVGSIER